MTDPVSVPDAEPLDADGDAAGPDQPASEASDAGEDPAPDAPDHVDARDAAVADVGAASPVPDSQSPLADASSTVADGMTALAPPQISRGNPQGAYWDLIIRGVGLGKYEGKIVTVRLGRSEVPTERLGVAQARVEGGKFELSFLQVWETGKYKTKRAYIDVDQNGRCDAQADVAFLDERGSMIAALEVRAVPAPVSNTDFAMSRDLIADCKALNAE
jgi:hypothetical protein